MDRKLDTERNVIVNIVKQSTTGGIPIPLPRGLKGNLLQNFLFETGDGGGAYGGSPVGGGNSGPTASAFNTGITGVPAATTRSQLAAGGMVYLYDDAVDNQIIIYAECINDPNYWMNV